MPPNPNFDDFRVATLVKDTSSVIISKVRQRYTTVEELLQLDSLILMDVCNQLEKYSGVLLGTPLNLNHSRNCQEKT